MDINSASRRVSGKIISRLTAPEEGRLVIRFSDGSALIVERQPRGLAIDLTDSSSSHDCTLAIWPTPRQQQYLDFIKMYMERFGVSPAEADIQRHFLVSAPSAHQMAKALERRGFITRQPGVARSIRLVETDHCSACGSAHYSLNAFR